MDTFEETTPQEQLNPTLVTSQAKDWFNAIPGDQLPPPQNSDNKKRVHIILIALAAVAVIAVLIYLAVLLFMPVAKKCLSGTDYTSLSGKTTTDTIDAKTNLYTFASEFRTANTLSSNDNTSHFITNLANLYAKRGTEKSIYITVSSDYTSSSSDSKELATQRIKTLVDMLVAAKIPAAAIHTLPSKEITPEDETSADPPITYIRVSSDSQCR